MNSAKNSYLEDIESDFKIIHIDPSIDIHKKPTRSEVITRLFELYEYCISVADRFKKDNFRSWN